MSRFTDEQLRQRTFERAAWVMRHIWEELQDDPKREARMHSRLFEVLIGNPVHFGKSIKGGGHTEHLVPCALLRDRAFHMYWEGKDLNRDMLAVEKDVAKMLEKFLAIADIHPTEAKLLDYELSLKTKMPEDWDWETGLVEARLIKAGIKCIRT
ncbi:hypothetical protein [Methylotenera sp.]|jgi:hypothetical protein|uniref:hypothetical protein n=1 Tax=Methylotenera sp. TaxID=2051956 RepID=UPI0027308D9C|nr:hypothetical protein [Methylotenera sp.]MDP2231772.1 hypothetical protein [Methylotenera sp.]